LGALAALAVGGALARGLALAWLLPPVERPEPRPVAPRPAPAFVEPAIVPTEPSPPPAAPLDEAAPAAPAARTRPARVAPRPEPAPADDDERSTLRAEIALLDRAIAARERGALDEARAILAQHAARFPDGVLAPERERLLAELARGASAPGSGDPAP
jgi:hypothetical protein